MNIIPEKLTAKDFSTDQEVRWCPGCGDYAILKALQRTMPEVGATTENTVFVSGIGCAARFPYYMDTYGFHTIHGRAPAFATGVKLSNPELDVWVVGGDGDMLSIGGNHLMHTLRRNVDLQILIFNNEIYGLTKGQYSPTSRVGTRSPSTPQGSVEAPVSAALFALGSGARFVARSVDTDQKHLPEMFKRAHAHRGASMLEIFQNCIVYNDGVFDSFKAPAAAADRQVRVVHGEPMIFGKEKNRGLCLSADEVEIKSVTIGEEGVTVEDVLVHDETNRIMANLLASMDPDMLPVALGVLYCDSAPTYEKGVLDQVEQVRKKKPGKDLNKLLRSGHTWTV